MKLFEVTMYASPEQGDVRFRAMVRAGTEKSAIQALVNDLARQGYIARGDHSADLFTASEVWVDASHLVYLIEING